MTTKIIPISISAAMLSLSAFTCLGQGAPGDDQHGDPYTPVGTLGVNPTFVQTGVKPNLSWEIDFPSVFEDLTLITPPGALVTTEEVTLVVQIPGASGGCDRTDLPVAFWIRPGASESWQLLFLGKGNKVNPSKVLFRRKVPANTRIDFAARGQHSSGAWNPIVWTVEDTTTTIKYYENGDTPPLEIPDFVTGDVESFLTPYLTEDGSKIVLGPKEMIYLYELESGDPDSDCYDHQDIAITVQFITKNNNGHGNNVDGVDVSNPGKGNGGPNGEIDPSGEVDDEQPKGNGN
jgi:hypothetical protein